jgi:PhnB protein
MPGRTPAALRCVAARDQLTGQDQRAALGAEAALLRTYWDKLVPGATILAPFETSPWGDTFGMLTDKSGVGWMINAVKPKA